MIHVHKWPYRSGWFLKKIEIPFLLSLSAWDPMSGGWEKPPEISDTSRGGRAKTCVWQRWSFPIGGSDVRIVQQSAKHKTEGQPHSRNHTDVSLTACNGHDARDLSILEYPRKKGKYDFWIWYAKFMQNARNSLH